MRLASLVAGFALASSPAFAISVTVDRDIGFVSIEGSLDWAVVDNPIGFLDPSTDYQIVIPFADSPFDPGFTPPAPGGESEFGSRSAVAVESPKGFGPDTANDLRGGVAVLEQSPRPFIGTQGIVFEDLISRFAAGSLDGDSSYSVVVNFDAAFATVESVVAFLRVRTPTAGTDFFSEEFYRGVDDIAAAVPAFVDEPGAAPVPAPVPLPAPAAMLASGLCALWLARRRGRAPEGV